MCRRPFRDQSLFARDHNGVDIVVLAREADIIDIVEADRNDAGADHVADTLLEPRYEV